MKVTMEEVARAARVSRATVSLALRGRSEIPEATRRRVRQAAKKLGYTANPLVSALMATRRRGRARFQATLAFFTGHATRDGWLRFTPAYGRLFAGARSRARELGYEIEDFWLNEPRLSPGRLKQILQTRGIHGIIVAPMPIKDAVLPEFDWTEFSVLAVGYSVRNPEFHRISHDYFHGMKMALAHCRAKGYGRIGLFLDRHVSSVTFDLWHAAYLADQRAAPGAARLEPLLADDLEDPAIVPWLREQRPDCLVCLDPWRLEELGHLPKGLPAVSLNIDEAPRPMPGVSRDFEVIGEAAVDRVVSLMQHNHRGPPPRPQTILIEGLWTHEELLPARKAGSRRPALGGAR
jgi:DNA-binding LacI/PurR family transcriptional regulator